MTIDQLQEKHNRRMRLRSNSKKQVPINIVVSPEAKKAKMLELQGDMCLKQIRSDRILEKWRYKNKKT